MPSRRRKAREAALKALYQADLVANDAAQALHLVLAEEIFQPALQAFAADFVKKNQHSTILAGEIESFVDNFAGQLVAAHQNGTSTVKAAQELFQASFPEAQEIAELCEAQRQLSAKCEGKLRNTLPLENFATELVTRTTSNIGEIDAILQRFADNWALDRMASLDRCILRFATCELLYFPEIPVNVTINEAIELAKKYSTDRSCEFVNGILDKIKRELQPTKSLPPQKASEESSAKKVNTSVEKIDTPADNAPNDKE